MSEWFVAEVRREGKIHQMEFSRGITTQKLKVVGNSNSSGTKITFFPDEQIFTETREFKYDLLAKRLRELAFLNPGIRIILKSDKESKSDEFFFEDGISEYVLFLNQNKNCITETPISFSGESSAETGSGNIIVDVALIYNDSFSDQLYA